jgi:hypothetical protein
MAKAFTFKHFMEHYDLKRTSIYRTLEWVDQIGEGGRGGRGETLEPRRKKIGLGVWAITGSP